MVVLGVLQIFTFSLPSLWLAPPMSSVLDPSLSDKLLQLPPAGRQTGGGSGGWWQPTTGSKCCLITSSWPEWLTSINSTSSSVRRGV